MFHNSNMWLVYLGLVLALAWMGMVIVFRGHAIEYYTSNDPHVQFVDEDTLVRTVMASAYFDRMTPLDLHVRQAPSTEAYRSMYLHGQEVFLPEEQALLYALCKQADAYAHAFSRFQSIPWKFAKLSTSLEQGFPHTLGDIILLSDRFFTLPSSRQVSILLHEKVHVYQRMQPRALTSLYEAWGFQPVSTIPKDLQERQRNNPDLEGWYQYNNKLVMQLYEPGATALTHSQASLVDASSCTFPETYLPPYIEQLEHPHEIMASMVPLVLQEQLPLDEWTSHLIPWMHGHWA